MARETFQLYDLTSLTLECKESGVRSSNEVQDNVKTTVPTFQDLPDEMLSKVFTFLDSEGLLRNCRMVSQRWKNVSSEMCRNRFVRIKYWRMRKKVVDEQNLDHIFSVFDMENLPWSSCDFGQMEIKEIAMVTLNRFVEAFGEHIWSVRLETGDMERVLSRTPNVRQLDVVFGRRGLSQSDLSWVTELDLFELKRLALCDMDAFYMEFLRHIIEHNRARLDYFKCSFQLENVEEYAGTFAYLLRNVPFISMEIHHSPSLSEDFEVFVSKTKTLCIRELRLGFTEYENSGMRRGIVYKPAEHFLAVHSEHLQKLEITFLGVGSIPLQFPTLPSLTFLSIEFEFNFPSTRSTEPGFLSLLQASNFLVLEEVRLIDKYSDLDLPPTRHYFPDNCHFESVTKLTLRCDLRPRRARGNNWAQVFPILKSLDLRSIRQSDEHELADFFSYGELEDLTIEILFGEEADLYQLFGIRSQDTTYDPVRPSIVQLTHLKNLKINFEPGFTNWDEYFRPNMLRDTNGTCLSLLQLQPLNLTLSNVVLPDEVRQKLKAHHQSFTIQGAASMTHLSSPRKARFCSLL